MNLFYKKRNREDSVVNPEKMTTEIQEQQLVLKLKKEELFDQHVLLPHAELNSVVYTSVGTFVEKYKGNEMTLTICTSPVNPVIQDVFREVYRSHYRDELLKVERYLHRRFIRVIALILVSICTFLLGRYLSKTNSEENVIMYVITNASCFCLWEVGYTQFATRDVVDEKKRLTRALNANIQFQ